MATQVKEKPAGKNDAFIEAQLARAKNRIRWIDLATALLGFLAGSLAFAVLMILVDRRFVLSDASRQVGLLFYAVAAIAYLALVVVRPLGWSVNPYYAARQLEQTLPGSRNHVINWIDLHGEKVPAVLKNSLGQRAARDLSKVDVDRAISNRRAIGVGGAAGFFAALFFVLFFLFGPKPFASLLGRTFSPFGAKAQASRTQVRIVRPEAGDAVVTIGNPITIVAEVSGRVPSARDKDAACLLYRHEKDEPYRKRFLQPDETNQEWAATVGPLDVSNGFYYKVAAGDAETPEYRVTVRAAPLISDFLATYRYRDYVNRADLTRTSRKLEDLRGTLVTITARTNRILKDGRLDFDGADGAGDLIRAELDPKDPQALRFRMVLDRAGKYRIRFTSTEGEPYIDPAPQEVLVIPDLPPQVRLIEPGKDMTLPANGQLELKGDATDDIGVARLTLRLQISGGNELKSKPYMADKLGQPNFGTPRAVEYRDLLELSALRDLNGNAPALKPGTEIEYWLEAADACDYPRPNVNVTASKPRYKIKITGPADNAQQQKERQAARNRQKEHEAKQAEQMKKEKADRQTERAKEEAQEKAAQAEREKNQQEKASETKKPEKPEDGGKEDPKPGEKGKAEENNTREKAEQIKQAVEKKEKEQGEQEKRGESRGEDNRPGKGKDEGEKKPGDDRADKENKPGEARDAGGQDRKNPAGEKKEGGKAGEQGSARSEGKPDPMDRKGEGKEGAAKREGEAPAEPKPGQGKEGQAPKPKPGENKDQGKGESGQEAGQKKPEGDAKPGDKIRQGESRDGKTEGNPSELKPNEGKDGVQQPPRTNPGEAKDRCDKGGTAKSGSAPKGQGAGRNKPADKKSDPASQPGQAKDGGGEGKRPRPEDVKASDLAELMKALKNQDSRKKGDPKQDAAKEREAKRQLEDFLKDIQDKARDPEVREAAKKALEEVKKAGQPGQGKPDSGEGKSDKGEQKPGEGANEKSPGEGRGGMGNDPTEPAGGKDAGKPGKPEGGKPEEGASPGVGKQAGDTTGGGGSSRRDGDRRGSGAAGDDRPPRNPEKPEAHRASMMQLEEFRKKVDKDVLKDLKMSPEEYEKFLRDYAELAKREPKNEDGPEAIAPPNRGGGPLPSMVGRTRQGAGKTDDVRSQGRPQPPPGYRDSYADFVRRLATPPK